jgi:hypothetical protein
MLDQPFAFSPRPLPDCGRSHRFVQARTHHGVLIIERSIRLSPLEYARRALLSLALLAVFLTGVAGA